MRKHRVGSLEVAFCPQDPVQTWASTHAPQHVMLANILSAFLIVFFSLLLLFSPEVLEKLLHKMYMCASNICETLMSK